MLHVRETINGCVHKLMFRFKCVFVYVRLYVYVRVRDDICSLKLHRHLIKGTKVFTLSGQF